MESARLAWTQEGGKVAVILKDAQGDIVKVSVGIWTKLA